MLESNWCHQPQFSKVELTPPYIHHRNRAEYAVQTSRNHSIATYSGVNDNFPIHQWDMLVPQIVLTLNLLRQSNIAPNILAYDYHHRTFDCNQMPLVPMGSAVQFHVKPKWCKSWGEHSVDGWYICTPPTHYQCLEIIVKATKLTCISDTFFLKHKYIIQHTFNPAGAIIKADQDLTRVLQQMFNTKRSFHMVALIQLEKLFEPQHWHVIEELTEKQQFQPLPRM